MSIRVVVASLAALVTAWPSDSMSALQAALSTTPRETRIQVGKASLYSREIGRGQPVIVLHGGPDFDHGYLLPDLDRLADAFRLIYYDQRGRGRSGVGVQPEEVTLTSDVDDLDEVRRHFQLESSALLGHSWGTVLALEYALRYPERVSRMILMNPAPASTDDYKQLRKEWLEKRADDMDRRKAISASAAYKDGDPDAVTAYYRIHFKPALARPEDFEKVIARLRSSFTKEGILKARAIESRLMNEHGHRPSTTCSPSSRALGSRRWSSMATTSSSPPVRPRTLLRQCQMPTWLR